MTHHSYDATYIHKVPQHAQIKMSTKGKITHMKFAMQALDAAGAKGKK